MVSVFMKKKFQNKRFLKDKISYHHQVPNVYKDQGYDWWAVRLQANCSISSFTISNGFILEANETMVLVSQTSDQVEDTADLTINPTFDSSQSDCGFRAVTFSGHII